MNEQQIRARLKEIATRLSALDADIDNVDLKSAEAEQRLANLNNEVASLVAERADLNKKLTQIVRSAFEGGNTVVVPNRPLVTERSDLAKLSMRDKMSYILGKRLRGHLFDESEKRALGKALTTTATEYVAASTSVDGVNNAGVFISTTIILDLLKEEGKLPDNAVIVKSFVSSGLVVPIAKHYGVEVVDVPVGFKYIGEKIKQYEKTKEKKFIFFFTKFLLLAECENK